MSVYEYYYSTKGACIVCFMHKGMYLINLLIVQKHDTRVGDTVSYGVVGQLSKRTGQPATGM